MVPTRPLSGRPGRVLRFQERQGRIQDLLDQMGRRLLTESRATSLPVQILDVVGEYNAGCRNTGGERYLEEMGLGEPDRA